MLGTLDIILIAIYLVLLLVFGFISSSKNKEENYLIADRKLNTFQAVSTITSSKIGAGLILSYSALVYVYGISAMRLFVGYVVGYRLFYFFAKKIKKLADENEYYTLSDFFFDKYGKISGILTASIITIVTFGRTLIGLIGGAEIISTYSNISFVRSVVAISLIVLAYVLIGGFKSIIKTDKIQFLGMIVIVVIMIYLLIFGYQNIEIGDVIGGSISISQVVIFFVAGILLPMASAELWQRVYAIKDQATLKRSFIRVAIFYLIFGLVLGLIVLLIKSQVYTVDSNNVLILGLTKLLPIGLTGLTMIIFYSIIMSSIDTSLFTSGSTLSQNIISQFKIFKKISIIKSVRFVITTLTIFATISAILLRNILDTTYLFASLMIGLGVTIIGTWIRPKISIIALNLSLSFIIIGTILLSIILGISANLAIYNILLSVVGIILGTVVYYFQKKKLS